MENKNTKIVLMALQSPNLKEPSMNPHLGLMSISGYLRIHGYANVAGIDLTFKMMPLNLKAIAEADYVGISCMTPQYNELVKNCNIVKKINPKCKIIVGGPHITAIPEDLPDNADIAIRGDGEEAFLKVVSGGKIDQNIIHRICLDNIPMPDYSLFNMDCYARTLNGNRAIHITTLRGCPYNCSFCDRQSVGRKVRYRSISIVMAEIDFIIRKYNIRNFIIYDDIFTLNKNRTIEFCNEFKKRGIKWRCWSRTDAIDKDLLTKMKVSGLTSITLGIESGDDEILRRINKGTTALHNRRSLLLCKRLKIPVRCSLMYGNPGETMVSIFNTINLVKETQPDEWNLAVLQPIPGSPIWDNPGKYGISFDKKKCRANNYSMVDRFGISGIGNIWYKHSNMNKNEFIKNLKFFVSELERVCPRKNIQDTIQDINIKKAVCA